MGRRPGALLMRRRGSEALDRTPSLSRRPPRHPLSPSLLRDRTLSRPNHVWAAEMPDLPLSRGFVYVFAVLDGASRRVLAWRRSNTLPTDFCLDAVPDARSRYGPPELFHPEQGGQCTSPAVTGRLTPHGLPLSMEGNGWGRDNVFVARSGKALQSADTAPRGGVSNSPGTTEGLSRPVQPTGATSDGRASPLASARWSRDAAQRFRNEPS